MRNVSGLGEVSALGLPGEVGVLVFAVPPGTTAAAAGLRKDDMIFVLNGNVIPSLADLIRNSSGPTPVAKGKLGVFRGQRVSEMEISSPLQ